MSDRTPLVVIVTGPPASGKSSVARRISNRFGLPWVSKDGIKETLFDGLGWQHRGGSGRLSEATQALLFHFAGVLLAVGKPFILEANFRPRRDAQAFRQLAERTAFRPLQVHCDASPDLLVHRFMSRWQAGRRHPGHADNLTVQDIAQDIRTGEFGPLDIGGTLIRLDTTAFEAIDLDELYETVRAQLDLEGRSPADASAAR